MRWFHRPTRTRASALVGLTLALGLFTSSVDATPKFNAGESIGDV
jgi:hypothetical protein